MRPLRRPARTCSRRCALDLRAVELEQPAELAGVRREHRRRVGAASELASCPAWAFRPSASSTMRQRRLVRQAARERDRARRCGRVPGRARARRRARWPRARRARRLDVSAPSSSGRAHASSAPACRRWRGSPAATPARTPSRSPRPRACSRAQPCAGAPVSPREPPATSTCPETNFVPRRSLRGSSAEHGRLDQADRSARSARRAGCRCRRRAPRRRAPCRADPQPRLGGVEGDGRRRAHRRARDRAVSRRRRRWARPR